MNSRSLLSELTGRVSEDFVRSRRILSFDEYFAEVLARPQQMLRSSAQYILDAVNSFGDRRLERTTGPARRWGLFDLEVDDGRGRVVGQEEVQEELVAELSRFVREGRTGRLVLLHGPNGSAKTTIIQALARALVHYSATDEGALFRFNWVFPAGQAPSRSLGFSTHETQESLPDRPDSYAHLDASELAAVLPNELGDHPFFLLPGAERTRILAQIQSEHPDFRPSDHICHGDLAPMSRKVFNALLTAHGGDLSEVLRHVQVERFYLSRRYRRGLVTVEPQLHVDAAVRQVTLEESYSNLPPVLRHLSYWTYSGDLVDANRGMIEYSDLLKRPPDAFKYLLSATEQATLPVGDSILYLDTVFTGTTNDAHLAAFKQQADWPSFKGRIHLVRVPYIRDWRVEQVIYETHVTEQIVHRHITPHAHEIVAVWGVLTRLRKPDTEVYPEELQEAIGSLSPMEKLMLYSDGEIPEHVDLQQRSDFRALFPRIYREFDGEMAYEGSFGASPRELKAALMSAGQNPDYDCLHPLAVIEELRRLVRDKSLYEHLQLKPNEGYHDAEGFIGQVRERYVGLLDDELRKAMDLVSDQDFTRLLERYALNVSAWLKGEQLLNPVTGRNEPSDQDFMASIEEMAGQEGEAKALRERFLGKVAAHSIEKGDEPLPYAELFRDMLTAMRKNYFSKHGDEIRRKLEAAVERLSGQELEPGRQADADAMIANMIEQFGYCEKCLMPTLSLLLKERYK